MFVKSLPDHGGNLTRDLWDTEQIVIIQNKTLENTFVYFWEHCIVLHIETHQHTQKILCHVINVEILMLIFTPRIVNDRLKFFH
jgi:hypothetical protein